MRDFLHQESWHALQVPMHAQATLCITSEDVFDVARATGTELEKFHILCGHTLALPAVTDDGRIGFLGSATYPDTLVYLALLEKWPNLVYVGVSDELLDAIGAPIEEVTYTPDAEELKVISEAVAEGRELQKALGANVANMIVNGGRFVANPLPWCVSRGAIQTYMRAIADRLCR